MEVDEGTLAFRELVAIIKALRTPVTGCPWDLEQTHQTLRPYLIEETYEALEALDRGDDAGFQDELGDLLLQVVLHAQLASERGAFAITEVVRGIAAKMVRRHPHVFGSVQVSGADEVWHNWEQIKARERGTESSSEAARLARLPESLPALLRAQRLGEKAARAHREREKLTAVLASAQTKFDELLASLRAPPSDEQRGGREQALGDVLFDLCQVARRVGLNAEDSLRACNRRFLERFGRMEQQSPVALETLSDAEFAAAWTKAGQGE
jgi:MazG family protein